MSILQFQDICSLDHMYQYRKHVSYMPLKHKNCPGIQIKNKILEHKGQDAGRVRPKPPK